MTRTANMNGHGSAAGRTVLCSVGVGPHAALLEIARPSLERLADTHGWELRLWNRPLQTERPPAWNKVVAIRQALEGADTVVWIDADAFVVSPEHDITSEATPDRFLWITRHHFGGEDQPNTGVMVVHSCRDAEQFLEDTWNQKHLVEHPWWEQAAMLHLLGFDVSDFGHARLVAPTRWMEGVGWLDNRWNSIPLDPHPSPCVKHYAGVGQEQRVALMSQDLRTFLGSAAPAQDDVSVSVVYPLRSGSAETALLSIVSVAGSGEDLELVVVDDGSGLHGVTSALSGDLKVLRHDRPYGLAATLDTGVRAASGDVVVLMTEPVRLWPGAIQALKAELGQGAAVATATSAGNALLPSFRSPMIAARRADLLDVGVPLGSVDQDVIGELCARLGSGDRPIRKVVPAVVSEPAPIPAPEEMVTGLPEWALGMLRALYPTTVTVLPTRQELPRLLEARGLLGEGAEVGVQEGLFSRHLLTYWGGRKLISIDCWEYFPDGEYIDVANVGQEQQDLLYKATCERLGVFGDRSDIWRLRSTDAASRVPDGTLDFVYLDAGHSYEAVVEDLGAWVRKVRPGGIIAGHDYLDGDLPEGDFGVKRAVDEFFGRLGATVGATTMDPPWRSWFVAVPADGWAGVETDQEDGGERLLEVGRR